MWEWCQKGESSLSIREKVVKARQVQGARFAGSKAYCNAQMKNKQTKEFCELDEAGTKILRLAMKKYDLSARGYFRILKVARTIADLEGSGQILSSHLSGGVAVQREGF